MLLITYSLLFLYTLPLFIILVTILVTDGFTNSNILSEFSIALSGIYLSPVRDSLGTFVVPFVTASAVTTIQKNNALEQSTKILFFMLIGIFLISIIVNCIVTMRIDFLIANLSEINQEALSKAKDKLGKMTEQYVKESLAYISLLLGISQSTRSQR